MARLAARFFHRPEDIEEVTQEVFLKVYSSLPTYRSEAPLHHWILRIATNTCLDQVRRRRRRPEGNLAPERGESHDRSFGASGAGVDALEKALSGAAMRDVEGEAARRHAFELLDRLPPRDRLVLVLMDLEGESAAEVARITGSTRAAVKVRAMRARRALRRLARPESVARSGAERPRRGEDR